MIITFLRSSSYGAFDFCSHKYFLSYTLSIKDPSGKKAILGSMVHKALECLARKKLAIQLGLPTFKDDETGRVFNVATFEVAEGIALAWEHYCKTESHHTWKKADFKQITGWTHDAMELNDGLWNPMNRDVIQPEQYFDLTIEEPWAKYSYALPDGKRLEGFLGIKGTVDLITRVDKDTLEYIDWKTGRRLDWATGEVKDWKKMRDDPQLRMYHYALTKLYPQYKYIIMTIVFVRDGGAFPLPFGPEDIPKTEAMLRERFETIKQCERPGRIIKDSKHKWKCRRLCFYGQNNFVDDKDRDSGKTICEYMHQEVITLGMDRATIKHGNLDKLTRYQDGGGASNREGKGEQERAV